MLFDNHDGKYFKLNMNILFLVDLQVTLLRLPDNSLKTGKVLDASVVRQVPHTYTGVTSPGHEDVVVLG